MCNAGLVYYVAKDLWTLYNDIHMNLLNVPLQNHRLESGASPMFATIIAFSLLGRLSIGLQ